MFPLRPLMSIQPENKVVQVQPPEHYVKPIAVCYGTSNPELGRKIIEELNLPNCEVKLVTKKFADGEMCTEFPTTIRGYDLFIIQPTCGPDVNSNIMELLLAIDAARRASVDRITAVIPYYGYARQDRKARPRQPISAKVVADILVAAGVDHVVAVDIHVQQIQGFFPSRVSLDFVSGDLIFLQEAARLHKKHGIIIASPDVGGAARCRTFAQALGVDLVIVDKRRFADNQAEVMNVIGDVKGKNVMLIDDMIDTAGSICHAAEALKKSGANMVFGCSTHAVFSPPAHERIRDSVFEEMLVSDTIPIKPEALQLMKKVRVISCAGILAMTIKNIHIEKSQMQSEGNLISTAQKLLSE